MIHTEFPSTPDIHHLDHVGAHHDYKVHHDPEHMDDHCVNICEEYYDIKHNMEQCRYRDERCDRLITYNVSFNSPLISQCTETQCTIEQVSEKSIREIKERNVKLVKAVNHIYSRTSGYQNGSASIEHTNELCPFFTRTVEGINANDTWQQKHCQIFHCQIVEM